MNFLGFQIRQNRKWKSSPPVFLPHISEYPVQKNQAKTIPFVYLHGRLVCFGQHHSIHIGLFSLVSFVYVEGDLPFIVHLRTLFLKVQPFDSGNLSSNKGQFVFSANLS